VYCCHFDLGSGNRLLFPSVNEVKLVYKSRGYTSLTRFFEGAYFGSDEQLSLRFINNGGYECYLYGCLRALSAFIESDEQTLKWDTAYKEAVAQINKREKLAKVSGRLRRR